MNLLNWAKNAEYQTEDETGIGFGAVNLFHCFVFKHDQTYNLISLINIVTYECQNGKKVEVNNYITRHLDIKKAPLECTIEALQSALLNVRIMGKPNILF